MKIGTTALTSVKLGSTQIQKIMLGTTLIWENWTAKTGELEKRTWAGDSSCGLVYSSGEITLSATCRIQEFTLFSKIIRNDITGRISGKFIVYGWNGTSWITLLNTVSNTSTTGGEWQTYFTRSSSNSTSEITKLKYEFYVNDTINRSYTSDLRLYVSKWEQKGA